MTTREPLSAAKCEEMADAIEKSRILHDGDSRIMQEPEADKGSEPTTGQTTALEVPPTGSLVPQEHGGALRYGGTNRGNRTGRTRADVQQQIRDELTAGALDAVRAIAESPRVASVECPECHATVECRDPPAGDSDRARAADIVLRYGTGTPQDDGQKHTVVLSLAPPVEYQDGNGDSP